MKLFVASASPFVAKVRMAAVLCGVTIEEIEPVATPEEPADLIAANPLGKIPALLTDEGEAIFDSAVICEVLDRMTGNLLIPQTLEGYRKTKTFEAAADGTIDALILTVYEERFRPEDKRHPDWVDMQMRKADRGLAWLVDHLGDLEEEPTVAHCALAGLVAWMDLRFSGKAARQAPALVTWTELFFEKHPDLDAVKPRLS